MDPASALRVLVEADRQREERQIAFIDAEGAVAVHTGRRCIPHAGHRIGDGWAVLGNLLTGPGVLDAMAEGFETASGTLAERMVAALEAAERAGGDVRGRQSAAIRIAPGPDELEQGREAGVEILIADHTDPVEELRRLVEVDRAYRALARGTAALQEGRVDEGLAWFTEATGLRHGGEVDFWRAVALERAGRSQEADEAMAGVLGILPAFREVLRRLTAIDPALVGLRDRMLETGTGTGEGGPSGAGVTGAR